MTTVAATLSIRAVRTDRWRAVGLRSTVWSVATAGTSRASTKSTT
jgi:hypothetical protein